MKSPTGVSPQNEPAAGPSPGSWIRDFFPGYFAFVMATGIVSLAWHFQGVAFIAKPLLWLNLVAYVFLWVVTVLRLVHFRREFIQDITSHSKGAAFLTQVAATSVLGNQLLALMDSHSGAKFFWMLAVLLWVVLIYVFFTSITIHEPKPRLETAISGSWLLVVVSTESLCTLGATVAPSFERPDLVLFTALGAYSLGAMFYIVLITLILYRWFFRSMEPNMLTPPYWINMGALAISTLAGARLLEASKTDSMLGIFKPFIVGFTVFFWATATWWIPLLIIVGVWKHVVEKWPIKYDPQYWSLVFPLGMYSVATFAFAEAIGLEFLMPLPRIFAMAALAAWVATFTGLCHQFRGAQRQ